MPNNFSHVGLIQAILPQATIVDVRRHPMDSCFSTFKQYFAEGQSFSYDLDDLGRYYRCYLALMDHWDEVLPGKVLHLQYEELIRDPETLIRRLLAHCGLPFESACLRFHETAAARAHGKLRAGASAALCLRSRLLEAFCQGSRALKRSLGDCLERFAHLD
jgi:hypothetical protein